MVKYLFLIVALASCTDSAFLSATAIESINVACDRNDGLKEVWVWDGTVFGASKDTMKIHADCNDGAEFNYQFVEQKDES